MDAEALVDREAPTPIHWPQTRRVLVERMQGFINERDDLRRKLANAERELSMVHRECARESELRRQLQKLLDEHARFLRENKEMDREALSRLNRNGDAQ